MPRKRYRQIGPSVGIDLGAILGAVGAKGAGLNATEIKPQLPMAGPTQSGAPLGPIANPAFKGPTSVTVGGQTFDAPSQFSYAPKGGALARFATGGKYDTMAAELNAQNAARQADFFNAMQEALVRQNVNWDATNQATAAGRGLPMATTPEQFRSDNELYRGLYGGQERRLYGQKLGEDFQKSKLGENKAVDEAALLELTAIPRAKVATEGPLLGLRQLEADTKLNEGLVEPKITSAKAQAAQGNLVTTPMGSSVFRFNPETGGLDTLVQGEWKPQDMSEMEQLMKLWEEMQARKAGGQPRQTTLSSGRKIVIN